MEKPYPLRSAGYWIRSRDMARVRPFGWRAKRLLDLALSSTMLVMLAPVLLGIGALVRATSPGPVIFTQRRIGYRCGEFPMYKFRTMHAGAEQEQEAMACAQPERTFLKVVDDPRTTPVGRVLRRLSLDELPQLFNVVRGDMSLVGPRPLLTCDFQKFPREHQMRRFAVKPGLTGLWQVSGRSLCSDHRRIELDLEYVDHWSLWRDVIILARTIPAVLSTRGAT